MCGVLFGLLYRLFYTSTRRQNLKFSSVGPAFCSLLNVMFSIFLALFHLVQIDEVMPLFGVVQDYFLYSSNKSFFRLIFQIFHAFCFNFYWDHLSRTRSNLQIARASL